jgi:hypothetical protein
MAPGKPHNSRPSGHDLGWALGAGHTVILVGPSIPVCLVSREVKP